MSKCNFCMDNIDAGLPPSCVAACPMRVLDVTEIRDQGIQRSNLTLWQLPATSHPFPLPEYSRTEPHLEIKPHLAMTNTLAKTVSNQEEVKPGKTKANCPW